MDCAIQNTWKWQFFSFSPLFTLVFLYFFSTRKKAMHLFTQSTHSRHAIDIDNRLSVHGKKKKLNRCVFLFIHSKHGFVYKMRSSYFHFIERKEKRFMNQHRDWWKWSETVLAFFSIEWRMIVFRLANTDLIMVVNYRLALFWLLQMV